MNFTYIDNFIKTSIEDMESVQKVIHASGAIIDSKLLPMIDEAEKGNFPVMAELYEMFAYGDNGVTPNYEMAHHYWQKLSAINAKDNDPELISESLNTLVYLHLQFNKLGIARDSLLQAFTYMVSNLEPHLWDRQIIDIFHENMDNYIPAE